MRGRRGNVAGVTSLMALTSPVQLGVRRRRCASRKEACMRLLVTGAGGMLGMAVQQRLPQELIALPREALDVTDGAGVTRALVKFEPTDVLHLAAWTDVDGCERDPQQALAVNGEATANLAKACARRGIRLVYLSSIAVFDGLKNEPYVESDEPKPANAYGASKLVGERAALATPGNLVVRSGWLFGGGRQDHKFVGLIRRLAQERDVIHVVDDCTGSPTSVGDLALALGWLLDNPGAQGIYHLVNSGPPVSRFDMARAIVALESLDVRLEPVSSDYFPQLAPRPRMEAARSERLKREMRPWRAALADYLQKA